MRKTGTGCFCFGRNQYRNGWCTDGMRAACLSTDYLSIDLRPQENVTHKTGECQTSHNAQSVYEYRDVPRNGRRMIGTFQERKSGSYKRLVFWYCCSSSLVPATTNIWLALNFQYIYIESKNTKKLAHSIILINLTDPDLIGPFIVYTKLGLSYSLPPGES
jgi:hypothetical protein